MGKLQAWELWRRATGDEGARIREAQLEDTGRGVLTRDGCGCQAKTYSQGWKIPEVRVTDRRTVLLSAGLVVAAHFRWGTCSQSPDPSQSKSLAGGLGAFECRGRYFLFFF